MLRRPARTALHSALSAIAGGLRGTAIQREQEAAQKRQREQDLLFGQSRTLTNALALANAGAVEVTPGTQPSGMRVTYENKEYEIPRPPTQRTLEEKTAGAASEFETRNRRAYGALRVLYPQMQGEYSPDVDYETVVSQAGKSIEVTRPEPPPAMTPADVTAARDAAALRQRRMNARAWFDTLAQSATTQAEKNRLGMLYTSIASRLPAGADPDDVFIAVQQAMTGVTREEAAQADIDLTRARIRELAGESEMGGAAAPPPPGQPTLPVTPRAAPVLPAPAAAPRPQQWTGEDYDAAFDALGPDATNDEILRWMLVNRRRP